MGVEEKAKYVLDLLYNPSKDELRMALINMNINVEDLEHILGSSEGKPYYRKLLYKNDDIEMLVMNWSQLECAPHDHGESHGFIQVLSGSSINTVYELDEKGLPSELFDQIQESGKIFYAPKKGVHKMQAAGGSDLVTLHLYSPPITGMKVYDLEACAVCVVSDDCGAWWPEEQRQKLKEIQLRDGGYGTIHLKQSNNSTGR
ncbi:cysteine dioxygenase family protein [Fictibacillus aquaticus]|uniref:Cysteine dioxygenase n=1 Tax=Fictibacillus aquaticus TaxID=2021314 RepID=A0A235F7L4_9BACL|nr:cysteine dioxygenase family protein [Fictibacillus aquaticus]OYD57222.1 hypothetical protein CGZ90_11065 [Fictibacillus aquaticus]